MVPSAKPSLSQVTFRIPSLIWAFTESDFATFVVPNTAFGILGAVAATSLSAGVRPSGLEILQRLPIVLVFNWANLLSFDLANQRAPESVAEDRINKPWRPIPAGRITSDQTRHLMLISVPLTLCLNYYLGVWEQGLVIHIITWLYNDLRGMDEAFVREILISVGYAMYNSGSLQIALGNQANINRNGMIWTCVISSVILTTMQIQDLKDQAGDRLRGRKTVALFLGDEISRGSIGFFVWFWTCVCAVFWDLSAMSCAVPGIPAAVVTWRVLTRKSWEDDRQSWQLWCLWLLGLYSLPLLGPYNG
ncbi:UbiA prenyltransferase family [Durotheca rogersii]|uniref:UbiA prenyltransferase family n=1 Tax=Durotheca rogersii TaxID=419775 RepID=UPI002220360D|nr:UbiA prenyltransferase family [Durotheca rogersii]KAI5862503.1 UbiA prenyltransferase family [Durotheca rogersii]